MPLLLGWMTLLTMMIPVTDAPAQEHPRLLVRSAQFDELRQRADRQPWRRMREAVRSSTSLTYQPGGSIYSR